MSSLYFLIIGVIMACLYSGGTIPVVNEYLQIVAVKAWILIVMLFSLKEVVMDLVGM